MDLNKSIQIKEVFTTEEIAAAGSALSEKIDVGLSGGEATLQLELAGDGAATVEWLGSNNGVDFATPATLSEICTGFTKTTGPGSDGKYIYAFTISAVKYIKIKVTETSTTDSITVTVILAVR